LPRLFAHPLRPLFSSSRRISHEGWLQSTVTRGKKEIGIPHRLMNLACFLFSALELWIPELRCLIIQVQCTLSR
jgi:hypothetical protein